MEGQPNVIEAAEDMRIDEAGEGGGVDGATAPQSASATSALIFAESPVAVLMPAVEIHGNGVLAVEGA